MEVPQAGMLPALPCMLTLCDPSPALVGLVLVLCALAGAVLWSRGLAACTRLP